jgi:S-formylglutathione hydrolase FrmB
LPASYGTSPEKRYPVLIIVPGFGGTHYEVANRGVVKEKNSLGVEFIRVTMNPSCARGHHVFADSANNGPFGESFTKEFLPKLDQEYRTIAAPTARFLTGHSSGGWSTLWLQTAYPEVFGGTWSTSPDTVDFTDFQRVNIYAPSANMYRDEAGQRRPLGRDGAQVLLWTDRFCDMEHTLGHGGQMHSFEAVFSPRGEDGLPRPMWDRRTGAIDHAVAETWKKYDIRLQLEQNWATVGPQLAGKLHVFTGAEDTFFLEGAVRNLKATLEKLGSDAVVEILPGKNHFNLFFGGLDTRIHQEMASTFLKHHPVK